MSRIREQPSINAILQLSLQEKEGSPTLHASIPEHALNLETKLKVMSRDSAVWSKVYIETQVKLPDAYITQTTKTIDEALTKLLTANHENQDVDVRSWIESNLFRSIPSKRSTGEYGYTHAGVQLIASVLETSLKEQCTPLDALKKIAHKTQIYTQKEPPIPFFQPLASPNTKEEKKAKPSYNPAAQHKAIETEIAASAARVETKQRQHEAQYAAIEEEIAASAERNKDRINKVIKTLDTRRPPKKDTNPLASWVERITQDESSRSR